MNENSYKLPQTPPAGPKQLVSRLGELAGQIRRTFRPRKEVLAVIVSLALTGSNACSTEKPDRKAPAKRPAPAPSDASATTGVVASTQARIRPRPRPSSRFGVAVGVKPTEEQVKCDDLRCEITVVTPKVIQRLRKYPQYKRATIVFKDTNDAYFRTLANLPWAGAVEVKRSPITDLAPALQLQKLTHLTINSSAEHTSAKGLAGHPSITSLALHCRKLDHPESLASLKKLTALNLSGTRMDSHAFLGQLVRLAFLKLRVTQIADLAPLATLRELRALDLYSATKISDLGPLAKLSKLVRLTVGPAPIKDLGPLAKLNNLRSLSIGRTQVKDLRPLSSLAHLRTLNISHIQVSDLAPLAKLADLEILTLYGLRIRSLKPLHFLKKLNTIRFHKGKIPKRELKALKKRLPKLDLEPL
ncbi:MAG: hypothetical protein GY701_27130 [Sulfitobacter sp.]|nr:hypothetical protein [Sulfitobacter sp.]